MKVTVTKLKTVMLIALVTWIISSFAQVETMMYVMKNGEVVFSSPVSGVDNVAFDKATPDSVLIIGKNDGSPMNKILLNDIQQLSFSDENFSVETSNGSEDYAFEDITKLFFDYMNTTGISNPSAQGGSDVLVYLTPAGDAIVESSVAIQSVTVFTMDGKMIFKQQCKGVEVQCTISLSGNAAGVYLLRVETAQDAVVKKIVKS